MDAGDLPTVIRALAGNDVPFATAFIDRELGGRMQARRGELVDVLEGDGLVAELDEEPIGLVTWLVEPASSRAGADSGRAEIRALVVASPARGRGIGRALCEAAHAVIREDGLRSTWLVTTNDNAPAIHLYESLGYRLVEVRRGAIDELRRTIKPSLPLAGHDGVEMHDEIEFALALQGPYGGARGVG